MKKHGLFKAILIILGLLVILSFFVPGRQGTASYIGVGTVLLNSVQVFYYFFDTAVFLFVIGGFYGVLSKSGAYKKLLDTIVLKVKKNSKQFVFVITALFAIISSLTGFTMSLFIFVPFVMSIILLLGYDKLVAISSTIVAIVIGYIGGLFVTLRNPSSYSTSFVTFEEFVGVDKFANTFPKLILLILGVALLIYFISKHIKDVEDKKVKYELNDNDLKISEVKDNYKNIRLWPIITVLSLIFVLLVLGYLPWSSLFEITIFNDFHTWLTSIKVGDFEIFNSIITSISYAFGDWGQLGNYMVICALLLVFSLVVKFISKMKFDEMIDSFIEGMKKMLPVAILTTFSLTVLVCAYNNGFIENLITSTNAAMGSINVLMASIFNILGSLVYPDLYYTAYGVYTPLLSAITDESLYQVLALNFQTLNGLVMLIGPTSLILIAGLTYLDIPYTTWLKYIWRFILMLFILIFAVLLIVSFI
mgnify:FL=1